MDALRRGGRVPVAESLGLESDPRSWRTLLRHGPRGRDVPTEDPRTPGAGSSSMPRRPNDANSLWKDCGPWHGHETDIDDPGWRCCTRRSPPRSATAARGVGRRSAGGLAGAAPLVRECLSWLHEQVPPRRRSGSHGATPAGQHDLAELRGGLHHRFRGRRLGPGSWMWAGGSCSTAGCTKVRV